MSEKEEYRIERMNFIRRLQKFRRDGREIIYINEFNPLTSDDSASKALIIAAASCYGPIASVCMKNVSPRNFLRWTSKFVLDKLDKPAIIVMDSSTVFRTGDSPKEAQVPLPTDSRENMISWLADQSIAFERDMFIPELYELICLHEKTLRDREQWIDGKMKEKGHEILYIPLGLPDLDPFQLIWMTVKTDMLARNFRTFNMNNEFMNIKPDVWKDHFDRVVDIENKYLDTERNFDRTNNLYKIDCDESRIGLSDS